MLVEREEEEKDERVAGIAARECDSIARWLYAVRVLYSFRQGSLWPSMPARRKKESLKKGVTLPTKR